jgi:dienelactone hydrolase
VNGAAALGRLAFPLLLVLALTPQSFAQLPAAKYRIFRPDGPGTRPAVAFVSGCDGFTPPNAPARYEHRAEQLRAQGYVVIFVDYLGRRAMKSCGPTVSHEAAAQDLVGATAWLKAQPGVDPARITAMGWSYGGRAVLAALASQPPAAQVTAPASVKVVVYPGALHGFDVSELPAKMRYGFATMGYHPEAAAASTKEVEQFLRR